ncbi:hypothetical protein [Campylobacter ureolyticus]|uniref:Membrane protein n=1 Tax=Campylobacter ureolyticus TaxID=827 RepID=A0AAE7E947_9BACT|nr:hypothetical protein [Campylobacter ureolyticus]MCR8684059.1 hypothetical protein [Campylobacter ureolyticus]QKF83887.1 putative membrane protein [Campylobacter ureolyticus]QQY35959.1 hypothetical protein I6I59_01605 [Campylobacter ureolyticus]SUX24515.1 Uncharacterised protein [Campylobacter ureolyticus]
MNKLKNFFKSTKAKVGTLAVAGLVGVSSANAAGVTVDPATGVMTGSIDPAPFMSGAAIILGALGAFWCVRRVIGLFGR